MNEINQQLLEACQFASDYFSDFDELDSIEVEIARRLCEAIHNAESAVK